MSTLVLRAVERELIVWARTWRGMIVSSFVQPLLFLGAMGIGLGGLVDENAGSVSGLRYIEFITPGLLVASAALAVAGGALWGVMAGVKWMGQFRSMVHTAMTPTDVFGGLVLAAAVRTGVTASGFLVVAALLGGARSWWSPVAVLVAMAVGAGLTAVLATYSASRESDETFSLIMRLGIMPLFLFSDTFFPITQLPDAVQPFAWLSPLFHGARAARMATTGSFEWAFLAHAGILAAIVIVAVPLGRRAFTRRLTP